MPKSNKQRQADYRASRATAKENGQRRLNLWLTTSSWHALDRIAFRYCVTKQEMLERLLLEEQGRVEAGIELDSPEWNAYLCKKSVTQ